MLFTAERLSFSIDSFLFDAFAKPKKGIAAKAEANTDSLPKKLRRGYFVFISKRIVQRLQKSW